MACDIPDAADCLRSEGWKQGCLIPSNSAEQIIAATIDFYRQDTSSDVWLVVLTQDCDLVRVVKDEPFVELLAIQKLPKKPENPMRGQSARYLHLALDVEHETYWFDCNIHDRFRIKKESLCQLDCDTTLFFEENELRLLRQWLARRYIRAAFPDHFETHLASTNGKVKSLFKSQEAKLISTVYIAIDNEDAGADQDYFIHVILTALAEDLGDADKREQVDDAESFDVRVMSEEDVTLSILRRYKRFDVDYRSVDDAIAPPEGIDAD